MTLSAFVACMKTRLLSAWSTVCPIDQLLPLLHIPGAVRECFRFSHHRRSKPTHSTAAAFRRRKSFGGSDQMSTYVWRAARLAVMSTCASALTEQGESVGEEAEAETEAETEGRGKGRGRALSLPPAFFFLFFSSSFLPLFFLFSSFYPATLNSLCPAALRHLPAHHGHRHAQVRSPRAHTLHGRHHPVWLCEGWWR